MKISEEEQLAINTVVHFGRQYGFGSLISHLRTAWAKMLVDQGLPPEGAHGGGIMPFLMHEDILERGEWDETGVRYRDQTNGAA